MQRVETPELLDIKHHPTFQLMQERRAEGSKPWSRRDGFKLGMVVEGGCFRSSIADGFLVELLEEGFRNTVDIVYGESVGSCNGASFISGQSSQSIETYWGINNRLFVNPLRILTGRTIIDTNFFITEAEKICPFDFAAFQDSGIKLKAVASRVDKPDDPREQYPLVVFSDFKDREDLVEACMAGIQMPFFCGGPYPYKGMRLWDGGIVDKFPIQTAIDDGCTHVLAVLATPYDYIPRDLGLVEGYLSARYLRRYNAELADYYLRVRAKFRNTMQFLREKQKTQAGFPFVATLALPAGTKRLSTYEKRGQVLMSMVNQARSITRQTLIDL